MIADVRGVTLAFDDVVTIRPLAVDPGKLHQVVQNLVRNAIEAARSRVTIEVVRAERSVHLRISDDGPGMPDEVRSRVFEPFFSTKESGTGMGMSIVHSFVAMHEGRIEIETTSSGTTIDVAFPTRRR